MKVVVAFNIASFRRSLMSSEPYIPLTSKQMKDLIGCGSPLVCDKQRILDLVDCWIKPFDNWSVKL